MNREIERRRQLIETSGMGLLVGISAGFALVFLAAALLVETWWVMAAVIALLVAFGGALAWVIIKRTDADRGARDRVGRVPRCTCAKPTR